MKGKKIRIYIDGGSRGNPGNGACAAAIFDEKGALIREEGKYLGRCTNNFAEYNGLILALASARSLGAAELKIFSDSELLVKQFSGAYKIKDPTLRELMGGIRTAAVFFKSVNVSHVRRETNAHADGLVNDILDNAGAANNPALARSVAKENIDKLHQPKMF